MNRQQLQELSKQRLAESKALLKAQHYSGAYYLAGYSVECALKAIIAKGTTRHDFPDRKRVEDSYSHNLEKLLKVAELDVLRDQQSGLDRTFAENWGVAIRWSEQSRYKLWEKPEAEGLVQAISQRRHGSYGMAHPALVSIDLLQGELVVSLLEQAGMKPWIALWLLSDEYSDWRLVIAEKSLDDLSPFDQLRRTKDILRQTLSESDIPTLWIMRTTDSFSRGLSKRFSKVKTTTPLRLSSTYVGDRFIEDAYVYRIR